MSVAFRKHLSHPKQSLKSLIHYSVSLVFRISKTNICTYSKHINSYIPHPVHVERQKLFLKCIESELKRVHGENISIQDFDLGNQAVYSIVDHHDILNHPLFITPNIIASLYRLFEKSKKTKAIISITDSGLSVSHFGNKRGIRFKDKTLRLFTHRMRNTSIYSAPAQNTFDLNKQILEVANNKSEISFIDKIEELLHTCSNEPHIKSYMDQVSLTNRHLWKQLFVEEIKPNIPELFHVSGELLTSSLLITYLEQPSHIFSKILFEESMRNLVIKLFAGIDGCWHPDLNHGTHFFWAIDTELKTQRLRIEGNTLISLDKSICIPLTKESILYNLKQKTIYPNLFLVYSVLIFYCGIKPLVGGRSEKCISAMKVCWQNVILHIAPEELALINSIETNNLIQVGSFYKYALDIIFEGGLSFRDIKKLESKRKAYEWMSHNFF